jgi:hypothetical protein
LEDQVIKALIELYTEKGIDLTAIIGDPLFTDLKLPQKIKVIKQYAEYISNHTSVSLGRHDIKNMLMEAALGGAIAGSIALTGTLKAVSLFGKGAPSFKPSIKHALIGAGLGALGSMIKSKSQLNNRKELAHSFHTVSNSPTDNNIIKLLATKNLQRPALYQTPYIERANTIVDKALAAKIDMTHPSSLESYSDSYMTNVGNNLKLNSGKNSRIPQHEYDSIMQISKDRADALLRKKYL